MEWVRCRNTWQETLAAYVKQATRHQTRWQLQKPRSELTPIQGRLWSTQAQCCTPEHMCNHVTLCASQSQGESGKWLSLFTVPHTQDHSTPTQWYLTAGHSTRQHRVIYIPTCFTDLHVHMHTCVQTQQLHTDRHIQTRKDIPLAQTHNCRLALTHTNMDSWKHLTPTNTHLHLMCTCTYSCTCCCMHQGTHLHTHTHMQHTPTAGVRRPLGLCPNQVLPPDPDFPSIPWSLPSPSLGHRCWRFVTIRPKMITDLTCGADSIMFFGLI